MMWITDLEQEGVRFHGRIAPIGEVTMGEMEVTIRTILGIMEPMNGPLDLSICEVCRVV